MAELQRLITTAPRVNGLKDTYELKDVVADLLFRYRMFVVLRCVKALHGHFRDDFNVSIIQSDEFGCFWVKIGRFIRNMTSSGLFTKKMTTFEPKFSSQHLVKHGL